MLQILDNLPDNVIGARATGEVTADDYRDVLIPALERRLDRHGKLRMIYVLDDEFSSFTAGAAWEDSKLGVLHLTDFERIAIVTDSDRVRGTVRAFGFVVPGELRVFSSDRREEAYAWVGEAD